MAKPRRVWIPLDVNFTREDKVLEAGWPAARLYLAGLGHLYGSAAKSGRISRQTVATLGVNRWPELAERLVKSGLWAEPDPDSYIVVAWDDWQRESDSAARTRKWRERQRSQGDVS